DHGGRIEPGDRNPEPATHQELVHLRTGNRLTSFRDDASDFSRRSVETRPDIVDCFFKPRCSKCAFKLFTDRSTLCLELVQLSSCSLIINRSRRGELSQFNEPSLQRDEAIAFRHCDQTSEERMAAGKQADDQERTPEEEHLFVRHLQRGERDEWCFIANP